MSYKELKQKIKDYLNLFEWNSEKEIYHFKKECFKRGTKENELYNDMSKIIWDLKEYMSEDTAYYGVVSALSYLDRELTEDLTLDREDITQEIDSIVDVYTGRLTEWLNESINHEYYLTEAIKEGATEGFKALMLAQFKAYEEAFYKVIEFLGLEVV
ncbi:MAG: hypothetical protein J7L15_07525 [Clostridiales bacterium]|nr:hypothetical protein [Clostridiales bacterium]